jgi:hypothetical protein
VSLCPAEIVSKLQRVVKKRSDLLLNGGEHTLLIISNVSQHYDEHLTVDSTM